MKVLNLDALPEGRTVVVPVAAPLWVPGFVDAEARRHRPVPYSGRVALSVPCGECDGSGIMWDNAGVRGCPLKPLGCHDCHGHGRLIVARALVEFVRVVVMPSYVPPEGNGGEWTPSGPRPQTAEQQAIEAEYAALPDEYVAVGSDGRAWFVWNGRSPTRATAAPLDGTFTAGQWAAVLTDVQPTTERCPACWGPLGTCPPIPHDGGEEWEP